MTEWYYTKMGIQQGPVPEDELRQKLRRGEIGDSNLIWREGMADWLPVNKIPELQNPESPAAVVELPMVDPDIPPPLEVRSSIGSVQLPQPPAYQGAIADFMVPNYQWQSIVALVISGISTFICCLPVGLPFAIVALVYSNKVDGLRMQGKYAEASSASNSAKLWMIISFGLSGLLVLGLIGFVVFAALSS